MTLQAWIAIFTGLAALFAATGVYWLVRSRLVQRSAHLRARVLGGGEGRASEVHFSRPGGLGRVRAMLDQAGLELSVGQFARRAGGTLGAAALLTLLLTRSFISTITIALLGLVAVRLYLARRRQRLMRELEEQLPAALELMVFALRAGRSLEQAIEVAGEELEGPLAAEFGRAARECAMGRPIETVLEQLAHRWEGVSPLRAFVEAVTVLKRTGGNLVEVLERLAGAMRGQAVFRAKYRALTAEGRISGILLGLLPLAAFALQAIVAPDGVAQMFAENTGRVLMGIAMVAWVLGTLWVSHLVRPR